MREESPHPSTINYFVFREKCVAWRNGIVQAKQLTKPHLPVRTEPPDQECGYGFPVINQFEPYGVPLELEFEVNPRWPHLDTYFTSHGFKLYSPRLVDLMKSFGVACESFPAIMKDKNGAKIEGLDYLVFHYLEQVHDCLDVKASDWNGDYWHGVSSIVLDPARTPDRAVLVVDDICTYLMREDLKKAIQAKGITGFSFVRCDHYYSGSLVHGNPTKVPWED